MRGPAPREAFAAGHNIAYAGSYFDQVLMAARLGESGKPDAQEHSLNMVRHLQQIGANFAGRLKHVGQIAQEAGLRSQQLPAMPEQYRPWASSIHQEFLGIWTLADECGWLFAAGFSIGELRNGLVVLQLCLDFQIHFKLDCSKELGVIPRRLYQAMERWAESSARLEGSEHSAALLSRHRELRPRLAALLSGLEKGEETAAGLAQGARSLLEQLAAAETEDAAALPSAAE